MRFIFASDASKQPWKALVILFENLPAAM